MFSGARDQSATQVQQGSSSASQETWPYCGTEILLWYFVIDGKKNGFNLRLVKSVIDMKVVFFFFFAEWYEK